MVSNEDVIRIVGEDIELGLREIVPGAGFRVHDEFRDTEARPINNGGVDGIDGATVTVVPWQYTGVHQGDLLGVSPRPGRPRELTIEGVTVVETNIDGQVTKMHRFVNWGQTLQDLDVRIYDRPVVDVRKRFPVGFAEMPELQRLVDEGLVVGDDDDVEGFE